MNLPWNVATGMVVGQNIAGVVDGADTNDYPDAKPAVGTITFRASIPYVSNATAEPNPQVMLLDPVTAVLDDQGYMCTPVYPEAVPLVPAYRGVRLIATNDPDLSSTNWTWTALYDFEPINGEPHSFAVTQFAGTPPAPAIDLATLVKIPSSEGVGQEQIIALAASAQAAAVAAANSAAAAAAAATVTDGGVAALLADSGTVSGAAVASLVTDAAADKLDEAVKGAPGGVAPLGVDSRVPDANLPAPLTAAQLSGAYAAKSVETEKLDATAAATLYAAKGVETSKLDAATAAATYTALAEINNRAMQFDQFPVELTDYSRINGNVIHATPSSGPPAT